MMLQVQLTRIVLNTDDEIPSKISYSPLSLVCIILWSRDDENILQHISRSNYSMHHRTTTVYTTLLQYTLHYYSMYHRTSTVYTTLLLLQYALAIANIKWLSHLPSIVLGLDLSTSRSTLNLVLSTTILTLEVDEDDLLLVLVVELEAEARTDTSV